MEQVPPNAASDGAPFLPFGQMALFFTGAILLQRKVSRAPDWYDCTGQERGKLEYSVVGLLRKA